MIAGTIDAQIVAGVDQGSFTKAGNQIKEFARDTGKELDQATKITLEANVAKATLKLEAVRKQLKEVGDDVAKKEELIIEINKTQSNLTEAKRQLQNFRNTGDETVSRLQKKFDGIGGSIKGAFASFIGPTAILAGISAIGSKVIGLADQLEQNRIAFTTMLGSAEQADKLLNDLSKFASKTPFDLPGVRSNAKQLLAMGIAADDLIPTMKSLGDVSAGLSVPLDRLALAYGQVISKGKLQGGELKQFTEAGVPLLAVLSEQLGKTSAEIYDMISAGEISSDLVVQAFQKMSSEGGQFANLMEQQSQTFSGVMSNITDSLSLMAENVGSYLIPTLTSFGNTLQGILGNELNTNAETEALNEQIELLAGSFENGVITVEEYTLALAQLQVQKENIQAGIQAEKERMAELNAEYMEAQQEVAFTTQTLVLLNKALERGAGVESLIRSRIESTTVELEKQRQKANDLNQEIIRAKQVNEFLSGSLASVSSALNKISTAKTRGEFNALRANAIGLIRVFKDIGIAQLELARASGDETQIARAKKGLFAIKDSAAALKEIKFVQTSINEGVVVNNKELSKGLKLQEQAATKITGGGGGGAGSRARSQTKTLEKELEKQKELEKKAAEDSLAFYQKTLEANKKADEKRAEEKAKAREKLAAEDKKIFDQFAKNIEKSYELAGKEIEKTQSKIDKIDDKIKATKEKIGELDAGGDIATRAIEIETELKTDDLELEKRVALEQELALAKANTTAEDLKRAELLAGESETEKIIRETAEKKLELETQLADLELQKQAELDILNTQIEAKKTAELQYKAFTLQNISDVEKESIDSLKRIALARQRYLGTSAGGQGNNTVNNTTTTGGPVSVVVNAQTNASAQDIAREVISAQKGNAL